VTDEYGEDEFEADRCCGACGLILITDEGDEHHCDLAPLHETMAFALWPALLSTCVSVAKAAESAYDKFSSSDDPVVWLTIDEYFVRSNIGIIRTGRFINKYRHEQGRL
jgi:hypothetical protein